MRLGTLRVLREIDTAGTVTVTELARRTATAQSSVSEVVARLAARGLVERRRSEADHRRSEISLSDEGRALFARVSETVQQRLLHALARLPMP
jgi:DNA-binding MarR family transcriptional regulator